MKMLISELRVYRAYACAAGHEAAFRWRVCVDVILSVTALGDFEARVRLSLGNQPFHSIISPQQACFAQMMALLKGFRCTVYPIRRAARRRASLDAKTEGTRTGHAMHRFVDIFPFLAYCC